MRALKIVLICFLFFYSGANFAQVCVQCDTNNTVGTDFSSAMGKSNTSTGEASVAAGKSNSATGITSFAMGSSATSSGRASFSIGSNLNASGNYSVLIGQYLSASGTNSVVIGKGTSFQALNNSTANSIMIGFGSSKSTFFVSNSSSTTKTGKIGIGDVTSPSAKLHIKADDAEDPVLFIEPSSWATGKWAEVRIGSTANKIKSLYSKGFEFDVSGNYFFKSGKVGIGTSVDSLPKQKLEVAHTELKGGMALNNILPGDTNYHSQIYFMKNGVEKWAMGNDIKCKGYQDFFIWDHQNGKTRFFIDSLGRVGIGKLDGLTFKTEIVAEDMGGLDVKTTHDTTYGYCIRAEVNNNLTKAIVVDKDDTTNFVVYGNGSVRCREVYVKVGTLGDFVFNDDYNLTSIANLDAYIKKNRHLPGMPAATDVARDDLNVGEFQNLLLQKIEEQALYIINLQKQIDELSQLVKQNAQ